MDRKYPVVTIVVSTYYPEGADGVSRAKVVKKTLESWAEHLKYEGSFHIHFADDGSTYTEKRISRYLCVPSFFKTKSHSRQERHGVGASLNAGIRKALEFSPLFAYFVDDWSLTTDLDITPWVDVLLDRDDIGMVRLGPPHPNNVGRVEAVSENWQGWALRLKRAGYAFGHRPALYHQRMIEHYGWFEEDVNALDCEKLYNEKFCEMSGPDVVLALPHPWQHLDSVELAYLNPKD